MKIKNMIIAALVGMTLSGCGIYNKYEQKTETPANVFGNDIGSHGTDTSLAQMSWREFFTDPLLQQLIEQVLANNTDLNSARIAIEKCQAQLQAARLAYLPAFALAPQGTLSSFDGAAPTKTYNLQMQMSWDIDVFGSITNKKRAAKAILLQSQLMEESTRANLVATTAQQYFILQMLDRQQFRVSAPASGQALSELIIAARPDLISSHSEHCVYCSDSSVSMIPICRR